jgi:fatty acid desaturase
MTKINFKNHKPSTWKGLALLGVPLFFMIIGFYLSLNFESILPYVVGQLCLAVFFFQCFILLHECGHMSFFKSKYLNHLLGNLMAFTSFIPFKSWVLIHNLHHKWTGYRDKDPTTEGTVHPKFSGFLKSLVNFSWFFYLPLFTIGYRLGNYWNVGKLKKHLPSRKLPAVYLNIVIQFIAYFILFFFLHEWMFKFILPAYILSLMISDLFILSQHSHIDIPIAGDKNVKPIRFSEQVQYTRSVTFFEGVGKLFFFNFNLHEAHHAYPSLPAYHLNEVNLQTSNTVSFKSYLKDAKSLKGIEFVFTTSKKKIGSEKGK